MRIKVGDKVRIKTEQELLAEGWECNGRKLCNGDLFVWASECGCKYKVKKVDKDGVYFETSELRLPIASAEVVPQTLDEYICGLPLKKRADLFVYEYPDDIGNLRYGSTIAGDDYYIYNEALQATIESLKSPKEEK